MLTIYGKANCINCSKARMFCELNQIPYQYKTVGHDITKEQLEEMVGNTIHSVPQIMYTNQGFTEYIGGFKELAERFS